MGNSIRLVGAWFWSSVVIKLYTAAKTYKAWTWALSSFCALFFSEHTVLWSLSLLVAIVVAIGKVDEVTDFTGKTISTLLNFLLKIMTGQSKGGLVTAAIVDSLIFTTIGFAIGNQMLAMGSILLGVIGIMLGIGKIGEKFKFFK